MTTTCGDLDKKYCCISPVAVSQINIAIKNINNDIVPMPNGGTGRDVHAPVVCFREFPKIADLPQFILSP